MAGCYLKTIRTAQLNSAAVFGAKVKNVTLRTLRSRPTEEAERFSHAAKILASNPFEDRALTYSITESRGGPTQVTVYNVKDEDGQLGKERGGIKFSFGRKRQDHEVILQAASTLACFLERWPHVPSFHSRDSSILVAVALELTSTRANKYFPQIWFDFPRSFYRIRVKGIDPDSGKSYLVYVQIRPSNIINFEVPEIPQTGCVYFTETKLQRVTVVNNATAELAAIRTIPDEDKRHEAAIKILRLILWKYHKKIMRLSDVEYATEELISRFCKSSRRSRGPYEGSRIYRLSNHLLCPSEAVNRDTDPNLPSIYLVEDRGPSALRVLNAIDSTWIHSGDLKKSWLAGWNAARTVNEEVNAAKYK